MTEAAIPDWVLLEAAKRCKWVDDGLDAARKNIEYGNTCFIALCDMILKHEQPPVDRKLLCAREAMAANEVVGASDDYRSGKKDDGLAVQDCLRAIELYESGFGE